MVSAWAVIWVTGDDGDESITGPGLDLVPELAEDEPVETLPEPQNQSESTAL